MHDEESLTARLGARRALPVALVLLALRPRRAGPFGARHPVARSGGQLRQHPDDRRHGPVRLGPFGHVRHDPRRQHPRVPGEPPLARLRGVLRSGAFAPPGDGRREFLVRSIDDRRHVPPDGHDRQREFRRGGRPGDQRLLRLRHASGHGHARLGHPRLLRRLPGSPRRRPERHRAARESSSTTASGTGCMPSARPRRRRSSTGFGSATSSIRPPASSTATTTTSSDATSPSPPVRSSRPWRRCIARRASSSTWTRP